MKALSIILLFLVSGCAMSTQELIEQARISGDWSVVNKRFEVVERLEAKRRHQSCPRRTKRWCISRLGHEECSCVSDSESRDMFDSLGL